MGKKCVDGAERQRLYDALKSIRVDGEAWLDLGDERLRVVSVTNAMQGSLQHPSRILESGWCLISSRHVQLGIAAVEFWTKDCGGRLAVSDGWSIRRVGWDDVHGIIIERRKR